MTSSSHPVEIGTMGSGTTHNDTLATATAVSNELSLIWIQEFHIFYYHP